MVPPPVARHVLPSGHEPLHAGCERSPQGVAMVLEVVDVDVLVVDVVLREVEVVDDVLVLDDVLVEDDVLAVDEVDVLVASVVLVDEEVEVDVDCESQVSPESRERFQTRRRLSFSVYSVLVDVGPSSAGTLAEISDRVTAVSALTDDAARDPSSACDGSTTRRGPPRPARTSRLAQASRPAAHRGRWAAEAGQARFADLPPSNRDPTRDSVRPARVYHMLCLPG